MNQKDKNILNTFFRLKRKGKLEDAYYLLRPLGQKYPENFTIQFLLGAILAEQDDYEKAYPYLKKAVSLGPKQWLSSLGFVHTLFHLNRWQTGFKEIRRFLSQPYRKKTKDHKFLIKEMFDNINTFSPTKRVVIKKLYKDFVKT